jgi:modulator of FtsH protease
MEGWENFFLGQVGASAALGGLLFVAISLNLSQVSSVASLADRALLALSLLLAILVASSVMLIPRQPDLVLGTEVLVVGIGVAALALAKRPHFRDQAGSPTKPAVNAILLAIAVLPYFVGGVLIVVGQLRAGLYFVAAAIIFSFVKAVLDAWVLLVEINR